MAFIQQQSCRGFSLLEVMVVVFLIATFAGVGVLKLGSGQGPALESEARQIVDKINLLMDESILSGQPHKVVFDIENHQYWFEKFPFGEERIIEEKPYDKYKLPDKIAMDITLLDEDQTSQKDENQEFQLDSELDSERSLTQHDSIVIQSDGVASEFELSLGSKNDSSNSLNEDESHWLISGGASLSIEQKGAN